MIKFDAVDFNSERRSEEVISFDAQCTLFKWPLKILLKAIVFIVLVDLNEFPWTFQKMQHSHSRHQKTP